jgi:hypothetical protein
MAKLIYRVVSACGALGPMPRVASSAIARRVTTCGELDEAMLAASAHGAGAYIEVVTDTYASSQLALKLHDAVQTLYKS